MEPIKADTKITVRRIGFPFADEMIIQKKDWALNQNLVGCASLLDPIGGGGAVGLHVGPILADKDPLALKPEMT
jgi:hypothetical protein